MFALIKWVEDEKFSILPTAHIRGFDEDEYSVGLEENDVYFVEWHQGIKKPKGGWPVFEASIIKIAGNVTYFYYPIHLIPDEPTAF